MAEQGKIRKMFPGGNTTSGPYFLFEYMIRPAGNRIFIIKGGPGVGKSTFMNSISGEMIERGYDVEHHHCSTDPSSLDGLVIPQLGVALLDGTAPHIYDPSHPGVLDEIINLGEFWDETVLIPHKKEVQENLFASALTPKGILDFKDTLISKDMKVYSIKGQPGTGVKEMIERVAKAVEEMGLYTEQYHCPFEPDKLDMLIIPAARVVIMNSTQPDHSDPKSMEGISHVYKVEEIDLGICIKLDVLAMYEEERADAEKRYRDLLAKGISHIAKAKAAHGEKEKFYFQAMNYDKVNEKRNQVLKHILQYTK